MISVPVVPSIQQTDVLFFGLTGPTSGGGCQQYSAWQSLTWASVLSTIVQGPSFFSDTAARSTGMTFMLTLCASNRLCCSFSGTTLNNVHVNDVVTYNNVIPACFLKLTGSLYYLVPARNTSVGGGTYVPLTMFVSSIDGSITFSPADGMHTAFPNKDHYDILPGTVTWIVA
jgi:hypothetical protein